MRNMMAQVWSPRAAASWTVLLQPPSQSIVPIRSRTTQSCASWRLDYGVCCGMRRLPWPVMKLQALPLDPPAPAMHPCVAWAIRYIDEHLDERLSLNELAAKAGLSVWRFSTVFRQHAGISPRRYICEQRVQKVQALLARGESPASAALVAGFYDQSHLCRHFKNSCGMTPGQFVSRQRSGELQAA